MGNEPMLTLPVIQNARPADGTAQIVEISFKGNRRGYFTSDDATLKAGEYVIVAAERGQDLGRVRTVGGIAAKKCASCASDDDTEADSTPILAVQRRAAPDEVQKLAILRVDEERVRRQARELVEQHNLRMKVTETEWQWDRN